MQGDRIYSLYSIKTSTPMESPHNAVAPTCMYVCVCVCACVWVCMHVHVHASPYLFMII